MPSRPVSTAKTPLKISSLALAYFNKFVFQKRPGSGLTIGFDYSFFPRPSIDREYRNKISTGTNVTTFFDPLLCKLVARGNTRTEAICRLQQALSSCKIYGPPNNVPHLKAICESDAFKNGSATTAFLDTFQYIPRFAFPRRLRNSCLQHDRVGL